MYRSFLVPGAIALALAGPAVAQENRLYITQDTVGGADGNTLFVDQSLAARSTVGRPEAPSTQIGFGNAATVDVAADDGEVLLRQGLLGAPSIGGVAVVTLEQGAVGGFADILQTGVGNDGQIVLTAPSATGRIEQRGDGNTGLLSVESADASATLRQLGDDNDIGLQVTGEGANVSWTVIGDGVSTAPSATPQVISNGGTVIVTQTVLGGG